LHSIRSGFVSGLGLQNGERKIATEAEQVIDAFGRLPDEPFADGHNPTVRDRPLFGDGMGIRVPSHRLPAWEPPISGMYRPRSASQARVILAVPVARTIQSSKKRSHSEAQSHLRAQRRLKDECFFGGFLLDVISGEISSWAFPSP